jgi:hypothetical protein
MSTGTVFGVASAGDTFHFFGGFVSLAHHHGQELIANFL